MINRIVLVGRLTKEPELVTTSSGVNIVDFTLAVNRPYTNAKGEQEADFINCVAFRKQAENINKYLSKGSLTGVDGRIQTRSYKDKDGKNVYVTEVLCDSVRFLDTKQSNNQSKQQKGQAKSGNNPFDNGANISSDLPF
ncbi:single-stranded DNA-binding protein [Staphylococcus auricularis]|uniref:single-stranded DNA-binding protein n=1 Tax=Staphylococcus auricularis TaxID=29379 RepID=UPI00193489F7|nr:single-stranded DNA-binding protein [Staphylococcus auricularis]MBM0868869.1 single-stranded DNA-binding protein [Staphylococcus auricularis]